MTPIPTRHRPAPAVPPQVSADARRNRKEWDHAAVWYENRFRKVLGRSGGLAWGNWRIPESRLRLLGSVRDKDVLELGCGAASWSVGLARRGARVTGLDLSPRRLEQAREAMREGKVAFPLVLASAESVPLPDRSFDLVFCDWGALTFADPYRTVPEVARLLRPRGRFVFSHAHVLQTLARGRRRDRISTRLRYPYFGMHRVRLEKSVEFQLPLSEWIRLFRTCGLRIERLVEVLPPPRSRSRYMTREQEGWSRRWPWEEIWVLEREAGPGSPARRPSRRASR